LRIEAVDGGVRHVARNHGRPEVGLLSTSKRTLRANSPYAGGVPTSKYSPATCGASCCGIRDPHVVEHDFGHEGVADAVQHDALSGLTGAVILLESDVIGLAAFGDHIAADAPKCNVAQKALRSGRGGGFLARAVICSHARIGCLTK
jgi:hypothetical protein